eukprot:EG_transcript_28011
MANNMSRDEIIARLSAYFDLERQECAEVLAAAEWVVPRAVGWLLDDVSVMCAICCEDIEMGDVAGCCPATNGRWHHCFHYSGCLAPWIERNPSCPSCPLCQVPMEEPVAHPLREWLQMFAQLYLEGPGVGRPAMPYRCPPPPGEGAL